MATIRKRGDSYQIRVSAGYDSSGKQIIKTKSWKPPRGLTKKQIEKELNREAVLFEEQVQTGQFLDGSITLSQFIDKWLKDYGEKQLKTRTFHGYKGMIPAIKQAMGHIKLAKLQPHHLQEFYNNLSEAGVRRDTKYIAADSFKDIIKAKGYTQKRLSDEAGVSEYSVRSCMNGKRVSKATADKIAAALNNNTLFMPENPDAKLCDSTIAKYHRVLSSILTTAVQWQVIPSNPCSRVKPPRVEYKEAPVLSEEQVQQLIECLDTEKLQFKTAIMLILYTGLRRGELCALNWDDIDLEKGLIHVTKNLLYTPDNGVYEDTPKSKQSKRVVTIPSDMAEMLRRHKHEQAVTRLSLGDAWEMSGKVFTSDTGNVLYPDTLSRQYRDFIKRHDLPKSHLHTLRHVSATFLIAGGVDVATVSKRLGHANKSTTLNIYTHAIQTADAAAAEKLRNILAPSKNYRAG